MFCVYVNVLQSFDLIVGVALELCFKLSSKLTLILVFNSERF